MSKTIGVSEDDRMSVAAELSVLLADTYVLYLKTQNFHWNVKSVHFRSYHLMFEEQYTELAAAIDEIAERIRALGSNAPGTFSEFLNLATLTEAQGGENASDMISCLLADHEQIARNIRSALPNVANVHDDGTEDFMIERMSAHEKTAWMLRSSQ